MQGELRGDFTRNTYNKNKQFLRVLMQQGRVQLDADLNEQTSILLDRLQSLAKDLFGLHGGTKDNCGFEFIATEEQIDNLSNLSNDEEKKQLKKLLKTEIGLIGKGNYYVEGILCENESYIPLSQQPDLTLETSKSNLNEGLYLAYLDVWERHITPIEDDNDLNASIREVALGGADTASRSKLVWQVKLKEQKDNKDIEKIKKQITSKQDFLNLLDEDRLKPGNDKIGKITARATKPISTVNNKTSIIPFDSSFRGADNQLYRVEIFSVSYGDNNKELSFVWSRENSSVVFPIETSVATNGSTIILKLENLGRDSRFSLSESDWVEIIDDDYVLGKHPRKLLKVDKIDQMNSLVTLIGDGSYQTLLKEKHPLLRRWDSGEIHVKLKTASQEWFPLENGIEVQFEDGFYQASDYWLIPARTVTGNIEWPKKRTGNGNTLIPDSQTPHGIDHHYAPLAIISVSSEKVTVLDCRNKVGTKENTTPPAKESENTLGGKENTIPPVKEFNRIINASWHHDQVFEVSAGQGKGDSGNLPPDEIFQLKSQNLVDLFTKLGLVVQFQKPVRIDSLHKRSVSIFAHKGSVPSTEQTTNINRGELCFGLPLKVEPVKVSKSEIKSTSWLIGDAVVSNNFNLITEVEPLKNEEFTDAVRLIAPDNWSQLDVFTHNSISQFTITLHGNWILDEEVLWDSNSLNSTKDLNNGIVADDLRKQFQDKGITLSPKAILSVEKENLRWRLIDESKMYILRLDNNKLTVSETHALDGNNIWPGVPERSSGNGFEGGDWVSVIHLNKI